MPSIVFFLISGLTPLDFLRYLRAMLLRERSAARPAGFVEPCRPSKAIKPPSGPLWIHEIKHDGFRVMVRREGSRVRAASETMRPFQTALMSSSLQTTRSLLRIK
jgi:ATP-dependent DNA ligase